MREKWAGYVTMLVVCMIFEIAILSMHKNIKCAHFHTNIYSDTIYTPLTIS